MEFFDVYIPFSVLIWAYLIGAVCIGYPIAKWSLRAWKYPRKYPRIAMVLFPVNSYRDHVGVKIRRGTENDSDGPTNNVPIGMFMCDVYDTPVADNAVPIARYIILQMVVWPARLSYTMILGTAITCCHTYTLLVKQLARCKSCIEI